MIVRMECMFCHMIGRGAAMSACSVAWTCRTALSGPFHPPA
eukprot:CAMPEP_0183370908 /NCGR_PEP_ID=MMETSP0164_2-20130417/103836_1 /TAXON_ID=221442 /ORGANISM="Coccolithus pelagicus ssp braarudi, Strain PLY182g" /LENGTH=40 /DNA_ID= /DNA_START= /DNA_END= /DNA_ORIENTATION=